VRSWRLCACGYDAGSGCEKPWKRMWMWMSIVIRVGVDVYVGKCGLENGKVKMIMVYKVKARYVS